MLVAQFVMQSMGEVEMLQCFGELQFPKRGEQMVSAAFELVDFCLPALGCG